MSLLNTYVLTICILVYGASLLVEVVRSGRRKIFVLEFGALLFVVVVLYFTTGFPEASGRTSFGSGSPLLAVALMFLCVVLGMLAEYFFYLDNRAAWKNLLKPLCVSPIVLLPMLGTLDLATPLEGIQLVSFGMLAFQNGFFWRTIFERIQKSK